MHVFPPSLPNFILHGTLCAVLLRQGSFFMSDFLLSCFEGASVTKHSRAFGADVDSCSELTVGVDFDLSSDGASLLPRSDDRQPSYFSREGCFRALKAFSYPMTLLKLFFELQRPLKRLEDSSPLCFCCELFFEHGGPTKARCVFNGLVVASFLSPHLASLNMSSSPRCASRMSFPSHPSRHVEVFHEPHTAS